MSTLTASAARMSSEIRLARAALHQEVDAGERSLAALIEARHSAVLGVRCYQLAFWLYRVGEQKATHILRGLPGHLPLARLEDDERALLLLRVRAEERRIQKYRTRSCA